MQMERRLQNMPIGRVAPSKLFTEQERTDKELLIHALERRLLQAKLTARQEKALRDFLDSQPALTDETVRNAIRLIMSTPEYQLC
jgi:hypothetical protein